MTTGNTVWKTPRDVAAAIAQNLDALGFDEYLHSRVTALTALVQRGALQQDILKNLEDTLMSGNEAARQFAVGLRGMRAGCSMPGTESEEVHDVPLPHATVAMLMPQPVTSPAAADGKESASAELSDSSTGPVTKVTAPPISNAEMLVRARPIGDRQAEDDRPVLLVLKRLEDVAGIPCRETSSGWTSLCPAHDDRTPSLNITEKADGTVLLHCFAGCETVAVLAKIGLCIADLSRVEAVYRYVDENNVLVHEKRRFRPKRFDQRRPDGHGNWVWGLSAGWYHQDGGGWKMISGATSSKKKPADDAVWYPATPKILYRLPEIVAAVGEGQPILFVEGEKDADNLAKLGFAATTNPGGATESWRPDYGEALRDAQVVFIPDADEPGRKHVEKYAAALSGVAAEVRVLELTGLPDGKKDVSDWIELGHTKEELELLIQTAPVLGTSGIMEILDTAPDEIRRPLCLIKGHSYAAAWVPAQQDGDVTQALVLVRDDGVLFSDEPIADARLTKELGIEIHLPEVPPPGRGWSGAGVKNYVAGKRADPVDVFHRVRDVVGWFIDFDRSIGSPQDMADLVALYVLATYFLDAFTVIGYLWPTGDLGVGKTQTLGVITEMGYLGCLILSGGTFATLRDMADYGALLAFDDAESIMDERRIDPDKRALFLTGTRKGTHTTVKEQRGEGNWVTRYVHAYCARAFSAIRLPDPVLGSRTITVPLVRSTDRAKSSRAPQDHSCWPHDRRRLVDDLFALALANLEAVRNCDALAVAEARLMGRSLEPWRAILGIAYWLEHQCGAAGLYRRMEDLSVAYQMERADLEEHNPIRWIIAGLHEMFSARPDEDMIVFAPSELAAVVNRLAADADVVTPSEEFTNSKKIGQKLKSLRFDRPSSRSSRTKQWRITTAQLRSLDAAYNYRADDARPSDQDGTNGTKDTMAQPPCQSAVDVVPAVSQESPRTTNDSGRTPPTVTEGAAPPPTNDLLWEEAT